MNQGLEFIFQILILIFSVVIHEVSHGLAALYLGDNTAKDEGRLTLNPINHLDPFGSILLPIITYLSGGFIFGWAKPVPYNPYNLRNQKWGPGVVGAAGPISNIIIAIVFGMIIRFSGYLSFLPGPFFQIALYITFLNIVLAVFNLVPIPPLDGSKVLFALFPKISFKAQAFMERYGIILLLVFIFFLSGIVLPIASFIFRLITGTGI